MFERQHDESALARSTLELAGEARDEPMCDLCTHCLQVHEESPWMLRSVLE
jgi:DNA-binding ferritin-like protein